jgi:hypothetical protein
VFKITVATVKKDRNGEAVASAHWYSTVRKLSFCSAEPRTIEHSNLPTRKHPNTATRQPANFLTLKETQQHHNTTTHPCPGNGRDDSNSSLGSTQQTHNAHPDNTGTEGAILSSVPDAQDQGPIPLADGLRLMPCYAHRRKTPHWKRGEDWLCGLCKPNPAEVQIQ